MRVNCKKIFTLTGWVFSNILQTAGWSFFLLLLLICLQGLIPSGTLFILKSLTDSIGNKDTTSQAILLLVMWIGLILVQNTLAPLAQIVRIKVNELIHSHFSLLLMKKANSLEGLDVFETKTFQDEVAILREQTRNKPINLLYILTDSLREGIVIVTVLAFLGSLSFWIPIVVACSVLPQVVFAFTSEKLIWDYSLFQSEDARKMGRLCSLCLDQAAVKEIRIYGFGHFLCEKFRNLAQTFYRNTATTRKQQYLASIPYTLCALSGQIVAIIWIGWSLSNGSLSVASVIVMVQALILLQGEMLALVQDTGMLSSVMAYFQTFKDFLGREDSIRSQKVPGMTLNTIETIEFRNVSFGYDSGRLVLKNLSFNIRAGEKIAIVGANGSGKSTLAKLLCRFYEPQSGSILVNGIDLREIDLSQWRGHLSAVFQDFGKYPLSLGDNVGLANVSQLSNLHRLRLAIAKGGIDYLLGQLPQGLGTHLGKEFSGSELSFGEWQKLAIARLFFRNSELILMDEPTASLDPESEFEIFRRLTQTFEQKTVLLIIHRLNSVRMCDKVLLLEDGSIIEEGCHSILMQQDGRYRHLFSLQASGYQTEDPNISVSIGI